MGRVYRLLCLAPLLSLGVGVVQARVGQIVLNCDVFKT